MRPPRALTAIAGATALAACALALGAGPASSAITPETLQGGWDPNPQLACALDASGACAASFDVSTRGSVEATWAKSVEHALDGTYRRTCDVEQHFAIAIAGGGLRTVGGSGRISCAIQFAFTDGSTINGTIDGTQELARESATGGALDSHFTITVLAGTGAFAGEVGTGTLAWVEHYTVDTLGHEAKKAATDTTGPDKGGAKADPGKAADTTAPAKRTLSRHLAEGWHLKLQQGAARAAFATTGVVHRKNGAKERLKMAGAEGAACSATAAKGAVQVPLGSATVRKGVAVLPAALVTKLSPGTWNVKGGCTAKGATAPATTRLTVS